MSTFNLFKSRIPLSCVICAMLGSLSACATQQLHFTALAPASVNLKAKGVRSLAVSDFDGPDGSGKQVAELLTAKLVEGRFFQVVEREKLLALEKEHVLGMTGVVDEKMAARVGKVLGVDALIVGTVLAYSVKDEPYTRTVMQRRGTGTYEKRCNEKGKCYDAEITEEIPVQESHHIRKAMVAVSCRIIRAETGELLAGRQDAQSYTHDTGRNLEPERGTDDVLNLLAGRALETLASEIQPHTIQVEREFENGGWLFGDAEVKVGIDFVRANRPADAIERWEAVVQRDARNSSAYYNLGLAYELTGEFEKAQAAYQAAERIDPKPRYIQAVSQAKRSADMNRKLQEQMR